MDNIKKLFSKGLIGKKEHDTLIRRIKKRKERKRQQAKQPKSKKYYVHSKGILDLEEYNGGKSLRRFDYNVENYTKWNHDPSKEEVNNMDLDYYVRLYNYNVKIRGYVILSISSVQENIFRKNYLDLSKREINVSGPVRYCFSVSNHINETEKGEKCLVNAIHFMYQQCIKKMTKENIRNFLDKSRLRSGRDYYTFDDCVEMLTYYKIPYYLCDIKNNVVMKNEYTDTNHNYPAFMASIMGDHIYLITDKHTRLSVANKIKNNKSHILKDDQKEKTPECSKYLCDVPVEELDNCNYETVIYNTDNLKVLLYDFFIKKKTMYRNTFYNNKVTKILYKKPDGQTITLMANPNSVHDIHINTIKKFCNIFNLSFVNQSLSSLSWELFNMCRLPAHKIRDIYVNSNTQKALLQNQNGRCKYCKDLLCDTELKIYKKNEHLHAMCEKCHKYVRMLESNVIQRKAFSKATKNAILSKQENKCNLCNISFNGEENGTTKIEFDHIIRVADGGKNNIENCQALCRQCHVKKNCKEDTFKFFEKDYLLSSYNNITLEIFKKKKNAFMFFNNDFEDTDQLFGVDINKCRRNILYYSKYDYPVYCSLDEPQVFSGNIQCGYYYIELFEKPTNEYLYFPLKYNGWYSYPIVKFCLENNIIQKEFIKYQLLPSYIVKHDYFKIFVDFVMKKFEPTNHEFDQILKRLFNCFIGCMGAKNDHSGTICFTKDTKEASYVMLKYHDKVYKDVNNVYHLISMKEDPRTDSMVPIFHQILDIEAIELYSMRKIILDNNMKIIYLNTDQVVCKVNSQANVDALTSIFDEIYWDEKNSVKKYKVDAKINFQNDLFPKYDHYEFTLDNRQWNITNDPENDDFELFAKKIIDSDMSWNIDGLAGTGKSTLIKNIIKVLRERNIEFFSMAPTNVAARLVDGVTLHKFCRKIQKIGDKTGKKMFNMFSKLQYILVDEISMVKEVFYRFFNTIKNNYPFIKFIISGDFGQLKPVNDIKDYDYKNSHILKCVCDFNKVSLTKCRRADENFFRDYTNPNDIDLEFYGIINPKKNRRNKRIVRKYICYRNKIRKQINHEMMLENKKKLDHKLIVNTYSKNQNMYIYENLPLIGYKNNNKFDIWNGEDYVVKSFNDETVIIKEYVFGKTTEIPIDKIAKYLQPAYAITAHKAQGKTFNFPFLICEWERMDDTMKYVALSRGTKKDYVSIRLD